jgi:hypothetical protein
LRFPKYLHPSLFLLLLLPAVGSADPCQDPTALSALSQEVEDQNDVPDLVTIRAFRTNNQLHHSTLLKECEILEDVGGVGGTGNLVRVDCTKAADAVLKSSHGDDASPLAHKFVPLAWKNDDGELEPTSSGLPCNVTAVDVAIKKGAYANMKQMGFHFGGNARRQRLIAKNDLQIVEPDRKLKDGTEVLIARFYAALPCWAGTASSSYYAQYEFKPFVDFDGVDGKIYRNWEVRPKNHVLTGGANNGHQFDYSWDLLQ